MLTSYKNDEPLIESDRIRAVFQTRTAFELVMEHLRAEDAADYKIVATNDLGEAETSGRITISSNMRLLSELFITEV